MKSELRGLLHAWGWTLLPLFASILFLRTVQAEMNYQIKDRVHYSSTSQIRSSGIPIAQNHLFIYDSEDNKIIMEHDLLHDPAHYDTVVNAEYPKGTTWSGAGGCGILKNDTTYYVVLRQRNGSSFPVGGKEWQIWSSTDLTSWTKEWELDRDSVINEPDPPGAVVSMEGTCLRKFNGKYYLYTSVRPGLLRWTIVCCSSSTISGLRNQLKDGAKWTVITSSLKDKDPNVLEFDGNYYMLWIHDDPADGHYDCRLMRSDYPNFSTWDSISVPSQCYIDSINPANLSAPGIIFYDESSDYFIFWGQARIEDGIFDDTYWYWTKAKSLAGPWSFVDDSLVLDECITYQGQTARFFDYHSLDNDRVILTMEWDNDDDSVATVFIWNYADNWPLKCRIWAEPDTVIVGEDIYVHMRAENTGRAYVDTVVPYISHLGDGSVSLASGPTPSYSNIGPQDSTIFNWVYTAQNPQSASWIGYALGINHVSGSPVASPEDTSNLIFILTCGDCNGDGRITGADAIYLIAYIYRGSPAPLGSGDVNLDGRITGADATYIINYIYREGPEPCNPPVGNTSTIDEKRIPR